MLSATAIVLLGLVALLAVPVSLTYRLSWQKKLQGRARLHWLFGLVQVKLASTEVEQPSAEAKKIENPVEPELKPGRTKLSPFAALRQKPFRQRILRFVREIWRALQIHDVYLRIRIGLGDPAETGQLWALFGPLSGLLANIENASVELEPEFMDAVFELDSSGKISIIPLKLVYLVLGLLCSPPFWRGMKRMQSSA